MDMILNKKFDYLFEVSKIRNNWKGHPPVISDKSYQELVDILKEHLATVRTIIHDSYRYSRLIIPGSSTLDDEVHDYMVKLLKGSRPPFKEEHCIIVSPMDKKYIYLIHEGETTPIKILPFIQMRATPSNEKEACYFYSRVENSGKIRLITYHYADNPDEFIESQEIKKYINIF